MTRCILVLLVALAAPVLAQDDSDATPLLNRLTLKRYRATVEADEEIARVVVEQTFYNGGAGLREADFLFPLPAGSAASGLELRMGSQYYGGNLLTRERARRIYDEITRRARDPALLDCVGKSLFRCRVFPVPARSDASVRFAYAQPLTAEGPMRRLVVPLDATRFNGAPAGSFELTVRLRTTGVLQVVLCPTHDVEIEHATPYEATVRLAARNARLAGDLVLLYAVDDAPFGVVASSYRAGGEPGYFVLAIDAAFAREKQREAPRDVVIAVDTSNSTGRNGIDAAAAAVASALEALRPGRDRYALMAFATEPRALTGFRPVGQGVEDEVREIFAREPVAGRTRLGAAIRGATSHAGEGLPGTGVILLTDGIETEPGADAMACARASAEAGHRVGLCGLGDRVDTVHLDALGQRGGGDSAYVTRGRGLADGVRRLLETTRSAPLTDVRISVEGAVDVHPRQVRMIAPGEPITVAGRYVREGAARVTVSARVGGEPVEREVRVRLCRRGGDPATGRIWAARRIGYLLDEARLAGKPELHAGEIAALGRVHGIVTPHSSLLVLEEQDQARYLAGMRRQPLMRLGEGGGIAGHLTPITREASPEAELAERIRSLRRCASAQTDPFVDLLGENRLRVRRAGGRVFYLTDAGVWTQGELLEGACPEGRPVVFLSDAWWALSAEDEDIAGALALGSRVCLRLEDGTVIRVVE